VSAAVGCWRRPRGRIRRRGQQQSASRIQARDPTRTGGDRQVGKAPRSLAKKLHELAQLCHRHLMCAPVLPQHAGLDKLSPGHGSDIACRFADNRAIRLASPRSTREPVMQGGLWRTEEPGGFRLGIHFTVQDRRHVASLPPAEDTFVMIVWPSCRPRVADMPPVRRGEWRPATEHGSAIRSLVSV